jgi:predicted MFS family arabinose efflux permease
MFVSPGRISQNHALRNRLNSVYMVIYFLGGAFGSAIGSWAWARGGWSGVCWCGGAFGMAGLLPLVIPRFVLNDKSPA